MRLRAHDAGVGHFPAVEAGDQFYKTVGSFLDDHFGAIRPAGGTPLSQ
jgi:hypothetical protein